MLGPLCILLAAVFAAGLTPAFPAEEGEAARPLDAVLEALSADGELLFEGETPVAFGSVLRYRRTVNGVPVFGGEVTLSVDREGNVLSVNAAEAALPDSTAPSLSEKEAADLVAQSYSETVQSAELSVFGETGELAYDVLTREGRRLFLSAEDGALLFEAPTSSAVAVQTTQTDAFGKETELSVEYDEEREVYELSDYTRNIFTYDVRHSTYELPTVPAMTSETGVFPDAMAVTVFENTVTAYDFYTDPANIGVAKYGLSGMNDDVAGNWTKRRGKEIPIHLLVHYATNYENAGFTYDPYTLAGYMLVGDGNLSGSMYQQGKGLDVIAHEYQHGVTAFDAGLVYMNESGALNEAFSDIFGALIEAKKYGYTPYDANFWNMGEDIMTNGKAMRSMKDKTEGYRYSVREQYPLCNKNHAHTNCDNGGVHFNSTIITHALYKAWEAQPEFFTAERIGVLAYSTLCTLTENATFDEYAVQLLKTAVALGYPDEAAIALREGLYETGVLTRTERESDPNTDDVCFVKFVNDGTVLKREAVRRCDMVEAPEEEPVRASDEKYDYTFRKWSAWAGIILSDITIEAQYLRTLRTFEVTFLDEDGNLLKRETVEYGQSVTPPDAPAKPSTESTDYTFTGWDRSTANVTEEMTVRPQYSGSPRRYSVLYYNGDDLMRQLTVAYGDEVDLAPPETCPRGKKFAGWYLDEDLTSPAEGLNARGELRLYAKFESSGCAATARGTSGCVLVTAAASAVLLALLRKKRI